MKLLSLTLAAGLLLPLSNGGSARAQIDPEKSYSPQYARCLATGDAAKGVTPAMAGCVNEELRKQDARLNAAYASAMKALSPQAQAKLRAEQRAWIKRRDASCEKGLSGGTLDMIERPSCHLDMTAKRAAELERPARPSAGARRPAEVGASEARAFPHDDGVVDLLVIGPAAQTLYDRLPGKGAANACGVTGLHKGDGRMNCVRADGAYSCHVWLDVPKQSLAAPQEDDC
jgi:uncharacterized protein YecT (DUF1311 family)